MWNMTNDSDAATGGEAGQNATDNNGPPAASQNFPRSVQQNAAQSGGGGEQDAEWATQEEYEQRTTETTDVVVPVGGMKFRVAQESPMKFASLVEKHGLNDLREQMDRDGAPGVPDVSMDESGMSEVMQTVAAFREIVVPNVLRPGQAYWDEPPADVDPSDPEAFDLSRLHEEDLVTLVAAVTGQDADEMLDDAQEAAGTAGGGGDAGEEYTGRFRGE